MRKNQLIMLITFVMVSFINGQVFETERGKIELLGLKKWNAQTLLDSMKSLNPDKPVHACSGQMKLDFGFVEVSSIFYIDDYNDLSTMYSVVTVIEDNENGKIKYLQKPSDSLAVLEEYTVFAKTIENNRSLYSVGLRTYTLVKTGKLDSAQSSLATYNLNSETMKPFWDFLLSKNNISDMNTALWILNNDSNILNRRIALAILLNFDEYDSVWWTLMNLQRYEDQQLSMSAISVLRTFSKSPRKINWTPAISMIKYILNGTNLYAFQNTLDVLTKTSISPELSNDLLENSCELILSYLNAEHDQTREIAVNFVRQIGGNEELKDSNDCKKWLMHFIYKS